MTQRMGRTVESSRTALAKTTEVSILQLDSISFSAAPAATDALGVGKIAGNIEGCRRGGGPWI